MNPSGKFLYSSNGVGGGIWGFTVDAGSGALTPMSGSPFNTSTVVSECVSDPSGRFLVAMDTKNKAIIVFSINSSTGALSPIGNPAPVGAITLSLVLAKAPQ